MDALEAKASGVDPFPRLAFGDIVSFCGSIVSASISAVPTLMIGDLSSSGVHLTRLARCIVSAWGEVPSPLDLLRWLGDFLTWIGSAVDILDCCDRFHVSASPTLWVAARAA